MKYIVLRVVGDQPTNFRNQLRPILCTTKEEVAAAIAVERRDSDDYDWMIFEVVDGRCWRRSVTYPHDPSRMRIE